MNFLGEWILRNGMRATVTMEVLNGFIGFIKGTLDSKETEIPLQWNSNGNAQDSRFDLVERKRLGEGL